MEEIAEVLRRFWNAEIGPGDIMELRHASRRALRVFVFLKLELTDHETIVIVICYF